MQKDEFKLALTYAVGLNRFAGEDIALLWEQDTLVQIQNAPKVDASETSLDLPIVGLLRARGERLAKGFVISTTAPPTEACLGMARMCGIHYILYLAGGKLCKVTCQRKGTLLTSYNVRFDGPIANVAGVLRGKRVSVPWNDSPATYKVHLKNWVDSFGAGTSTTTLSKC